MMGFCLVILHPRVCLGLAKLLFAKVGGPNPVEVLGQSHRHLAASRTTIPVQLAMRDERQELYEKRLGIGGSELSIVGGVTTVVVAG